MWSEFPSPSPQPQFTSQRTCAPAMLPPGDKHSSKSSDVHCSLAKGGFPGSHHLLPCILPPVNHTSKMFNAPTPSVAQNMTHFLRSVLDISVLYFPSRYQKIKRIFQNHIVIKKAGRFIYSLKTHKLFNWQSHWQGVGTKPTVCWMSTSLVDSHSGHHLCCTVDSILKHPC